MKKLYTLIIFTITLSLNLSGQEYISAIGAKGGTGLVASYKLNAGGPGYLELIGGLDLGENKNLFITGYFEKHRSLGDSNVYWYHGPGAGVIFESGIGQESGNTAITLGWILGLDIGLEEIPLNFSLDIAPAIVLNGDSNFQPLFNGAIRYILNR